MVHALKLPCRFQSWKFMAGLMQVYRKFCAHPTTSVRVHPKLHTQTCAVKLGYSAICKHVLKLRWKKYVHNHELINIWPPHLHIQRFVKNLKGTVTKTAFIQIRKGENGLKRLHLYFWASKPGLTLKTNECKKNQINKTM